MNINSGGYGTRAQQTNGYETMRAVGLVLMGFGIVSLITALFFTGGRGKSVTKSLPAEGGIVGPIEVSKDNTVLEVGVRQPLNKDGWSFIEGEVLDKDQEYLFGFGEEVWRESGYDQGYWSETDDAFDLKVTIPKKGTYFLSFTTESAPTMSLRRTSLRRRKNDRPVAGNIWITVQPKMGSTVPFFIAGLVGLILGFIVNRIGAAGANVSALGRMGET